MSFTSFNLQNKFTVSSLSVWFSLYYKVTAPKLSQMVAAIFCICYNPKPSHSKGRQFKSDYVEHSNQSLMAQRTKSLKRAILHQLFLKKETRRYHHHPGVYQDFDKFSRVTCTLAMKPFEIWALPIASGSYRRWFSCPFILQVYAQKEEPAAWWMSVGSMVAAELQ